MTSTEQIKKLNDNFRHNIFRPQPHNHLILTQQVSALPQTSLIELLTQVRDFEDFTPGNDPYGEHDFGKIVYHGENYFFKLDYYDTDMRHGSADPANESITERVLTIMHASEY